MNKDVKPSTGRAVRIQAPGALLEAELTLPEEARGLVVFAHGSGSSRMSPRNKFVAGVLHDSGFGTLLMDLLTAEEEAVDMYTRHLRFNIALLSERLVAAVDWASENPETRNLRIGIFGASTGSAAALVAAAERPERVGAVVSRGGRPDLAEPALARVRAPTLLIVGGNDDIVIELNREAYQKLKTEKKLDIIPGATHLFEEPGALEQVARLAADWFIKHLAPEPVRARS